MNNRDIIVRIIQPADKPQAPKFEHQTKHHENKQHVRHHKIANRAGLASIALFAAVVAVSFFRSGFSVNDVLVIVSIPLAMGIVTSYAIFN